MKTQDTFSLPIVLQRRPFLSICRSGIIAALVASFIYSIISIAQARPDAWRAEGWKTDFSKSSIDFTEIKSGGPPKDGIPPIDQPRFKSAARIKNLDAKEPVIRLVIGEDARAYPLRVMIWHEIVNDTVGNIPVTVTYCPLCNSAIVFDRRIEGKLLDFGTSGKLRNSDLVMYDRQSESWWQQFSGEAITGSMTGKELTRIPVRLESFAKFKAEFPQGKVLVPNNPRFRAYGENPYAGYDQAFRPFLYNGDMPEGIEPMARVIVLRPKNRQPLAITMEAVRKTGHWKKGNLEILWKKGLRSAVNLSSIAHSRDVGAVQVYHIEADGSRKPLAHEVTFAFVFHAFHKSEKILKK